MHMSMQRRITVKDLRWEYTKMIKAIKAWWNTPRMTPEEKYLSQSQDLVDLENRINELKRKGTWV